MITVCRVCGEPDACHRDDDTGVVRWCPEPTPSHPTLRGQPLDASSELMGQLFDGAWIRGCVWGACQVLAGRGHRYTARMGREVEAIYRRLRTTDNQVLADLWEADNGGLGLF